MKAPGKKILLIDDEEVFRKLISAALTTGGYRCIPVTNPADGIKQLKQETYDLVLLDIIMDPLDGWDTLAQIRSLPHGPDIPVIVFSVKKLNVDEIIRYGEYLYGFLKKPFVDTELCDSISAFFSWYDTLLSNISAAKNNGVPENICHNWVHLVRQIHVFNQLVEFVSPYCIPDGSLSEEECLAERMKLIHHMIDERIRDRDNIRLLYPVLTV